MRRKAKQASPQSSFFDTVGRSEYGEGTIPKPVKLEVAEGYLEFPKIVRGSFYCPDCGSKVTLRPDGSAACPKCVVRVPTRAARMRGIK